MRRLFGLFVMGSFTTACTTIPVEPNYPDPDVENPGVVIEAQPLPEPPPAPRVETPTPAPTAPPPEPVIEAPEPSGFAALPHWGKHNPFL